jgi:hypothetical protein
MELGGYSQPPEAVLRHARDAGPIQDGTYRVVIWATRLSHHDCATLAEARRQADDVASEADYETVPPAAYIIDSDYQCVDIGIHYGIRRDGMSAWESFQIYRNG